MKHLFIALFSLLSINVLSQVNQYHEDGTRHGLWEKKFEGTDQVRYTGTFNKGVETGVFKFYTRGFPKKPSAIKTFSENGKKEEIVYYSQQGEKISEGQLILRKREGKWVYYHNRSGNVMMVEHYENDQLQGTQTSYYDNKQISETTEFLNGKKEGKQLVYSLKGVLIKEFTYSNDKLNGPNKFYNGKGVLTIDGNYENDKKTGVWKYYDNGKLIRQKQY